MDGENNGKPYENGWFGGFHPLFSETSIWSLKYLVFDFLQMQQGNEHQRTFPLRPNPPPPATSATWNLSVQICKIWTIFFGEVEMFGMWAISIYIYIQSYIWVVSYLNTYIHTLEVLGQDLLNRLVNEVVGFIIIQKQPPFFSMVQWWLNSRVYIYIYIHVYNTYLYPNIYLETQPSPLCSDVCFTNQTNFCRHVPQLWSHWVGCFLQNIDLVLCLFSFEKRNSHLQYTPKSDHFNSRLWISCETPQLFFKVKLVWEISWVLPISHCNTTQHVSRIKPFP